MKKESETRGIFKKPDKVNLFYNNPFIMTFHKERVEAIKSKLQ